MKTDEIGYTVNSASTSETHWIDVNINVNTFENTPVVRVEFNVDKGLRALVYENPDYESEPTIVDLNQYLS